MINKLNNIVIVITIWLALSSTLIHAHEEPMEAGWCKAGKVTIIGHFKLNQDILSLFKGPENAVCLLQKSCGQFDDDDYSVGLRAASSLCHMYSAAELEFRHNADHLTVRPIFYSPNSFRNSEVNHHSLYSIAQGVEFSCGICKISAERKVEK